MLKFEEFKFAIIGLVAIIVVYSIYENLSWNQLKEDAIASLPQPGS